MADAATLDTTLPEALRTRLDTLSGFEGALLLREGAEGVALALRRPTGLVLRLAAFWISPGAADAEATARALAARLEAAAREAGLLALRAAPEDAPWLDPAGLRHLGLAPLAAPYAERWLGNDAPRRALPLYAQTTPFTCGPASLLMGFQALAGRAPTRSEEIALWREATTIVSLAGPGGCDPHGLALAARARGFGARILATTDRALLTERADTAQKRELIEFAQSELWAQSAAAGIPVTLGDFAIAPLAAHLGAGGLVLLLIDQHPTHGRHSPHWILLHQARDGWFLVNDPWPDPPRGETAADAANLPIRAEALERMAWFGEPPYRAAVLLTPPGDGAGD